MSLMPEKGLGVIGCCFSVIGSVLVAMDVWRTWANKAAAGSILCAALSIFAPLFLLLSAPLVGPSGALAFVVHIGQTSCTSQDSMSDAVLQMGRTRGPVPLSIWSLFPLISSLAVPPASQRRAAPPVVGQSPGEPRWATLPARAWTAQAAAAALKRVVLAAGAFVPFVLSRWQYAASIVRRQTVAAAKRGAAAAGAAGAASYHPVIAASGAASQCRPGSPLALSIKLEGPALSDMTPAARATLTRLIERRVATSYAAPRAPLGAATAAPFPRVTLNAVEGCVLLVCRGYTESGGVSTPVEIDLSSEEVLGMLPADVRKRVTSAVIGREWIKGVAAPRSSLIPLGEATPVAFNVAAASDAESDFPAENPRLSVWWGPDGARKPGSLSDIRWGPGVVEGRILVGSKAASARPLLVMVAVEDGARPHVASNVVFLAAVPSDALSDMQSVPESFEDLSRDVVALLQMLEEAEASSRPVHHRFYDVLESLRDFADSSSLPHLSRMLRRIEAAAAAAPLPSLAKQVRSAASAAARLVDSLATTSPRGLASALLGAAAAFWFMEPGPLAHAVAAAIAIASMALLAKRDQEAGPVQGGSIGLNGLNVLGPSAAAAAAAAGGGKPLSLVAPAAQRSAEMRESKGPPPGQAQARNRSDKTTSLRGSSDQAF